MKVRTLVETTQEIEVDVSLDDVMAEISSLETPQRKNETMRLLSLCVGAAKRVPDASIAEMSDEQRKIIANALQEEAGRYMTANVQVQAPCAASCARSPGTKC